MKHLKVCQKYSAVRRRFNSFLGGSSGDETLRLILDILEIRVSQNLAHLGGGGQWNVRDGRGVSELLLTFQLPLFPHWFFQVLYQISPVAILMTKSNKKRKYH